jgi:hypothetical protein
MTSETQSVSVPNAASKTLSRKYSPPNRSGKIANAIKSAARIQSEIFFAEFIFNRVDSKFSPLGRLQFETLIDPFDLWWVFLSRFFMDKMMFPPGGMTWLGGVTRETPVRTEPYPTLRKNAPFRIGRPGLSQGQQSPATAERLRSNWIVACSIPKRVLNSPQTVRSKASSPSGCGLTKWTVKAVSVVLRGQMCK